MPEQSLLNTHIFSISHVTASDLRNSGQHIGTMLAGHFKHQNHQQKAQKCGKVAPNSP